MRYLIRALKYFIYFVIIFTLVMLIMSALGLVDPNPQAMFRDGWKSVWQIAALFFVIALVYPLTGFRKQEAIVPGEYDEIKDKVVSFMSSKGYELESEEGETMTFRLRSKVGQAFKMFEDRITMVKSPTGFEIEGLRKVIVRIISGLEYSFK
mgnify:CR=1 FL=1